MCLENPSFFEVLLWDFWVVIFFRSYILWFFFNSNIFDFLLTFLDFFNLQTKIILLLSLFHFCYSFDLLILRNLSFMTVFLNQYFMFHKIAIITVCLIICLSIIFEFIKVCLYIRFFCSPVASTTMKLKGIY